MDSRAMGVTVNQQRASAIEEGVLDCGVVHIHDVG
jgi:hypothetical protein